MKLFISLISVITQINLCQSYDEINPLIIMTREEYIDLRNGKWLTTLVDMEESEQKKICETVLKAPLYMFVPSDINEYYILLKRDKLLSRTELEMIPIPFRDYYFRNPEITPLLWCSFGYISFYLGTYSNHEGYIMHSESLTPVGVVTKSYRYEHSGESIRNMICLRLTTLPRESRIEKNPTLPLYSLNRFNRGKLCATFIAQVLPNIRDLPPENKRNIEFTERFLFTRLNQFPFLGEYLKCRFWNEGSGETGIILYILQIEKHRIIILNNQICDVFNILEFEAESSSSG